MRRYNPYVTPGPHETALFGCAFLFVIGFSILCAGGYVIMSKVLS